MGVFTRMMEGLATAGAERKMVMIDATYLKRTARHRACKKKGAGRQVRRTKFRTSLVSCEHEDLARIE